MAKRYLRLKEHQPLKSGSWTPTQDYRDRTDGSLQEGPFEYKSSHNGFLVSGAEHSKHLPNVFLVGGSFVESSFSLPEERFPSQLNNLFENHNVINAGYSGTTTLQAVLMIIGKLPIYAKKGDTVLLFIAKSDANVAPLDGGYWNSSRTYSPIVPNDFETSWESSQSDLEALITTVKVFLDGIGLSLLVSTCPHRSGDFSHDKWLRLAYRRDRNAYENRVTIRNNIDLYTRQITANLDLPLLDLSEKFTDRDEFFYDEMHLNSLGQAEVTKALAEFLPKHI